MMLEASLLRFGGRGAFLNVLYVRCFAYTVSECGTKHFVTVHSVHSSVAKIHSRLPVAMEFWLVCHFPTIFAYISGLRSLKSPQFSLSAFNASKSKVLTSTPSSPPGSSAQRAPVLSVIKEEP